MSDLAKQYEAIWESNDYPPDVFAFLEQHNGSANDDVLAVLLTDQNHRWKTDAPFQVEDYLTRLSDLASHPDFKLELAVGEFQAQHLADTSPNIEEFTSRFCDISDQLRNKLLELESGDDKTQDRSQVTASFISDQFRNKSFELASDEDKTQDRSQTTATLIINQTVGKGQLGRYRIQRVLGEGAFGRVFLSYDEELQRHVAIKVPTETRFQKPEDAEQYLEEARTVASLNHPNIVPVYDTGRTDDGSIYVVSRFIEGQTLADRIKTDRPNHDETAKLLATAAQALQHAHERRLIHRDVKPANILLEGSEAIPYVADFGLAIREEDYLQEGKFAGTPAYMSPEQARGEGHRLDGRSDIFSLGVVLYELLTGKKPFRGSTPNEMFHQVISVDAQPPRELDNTIPVELERICLKSLCKRASDRYATAAELADDLLHWNQSPQQDIRELQIVPKGLRSFDANDADFFLDLLPGPRNRNGLPESIQFWKTRIEETDPDKTFSVGLIYGPSGCGKSSLVKAGLLPRLSKDVTAIYVEATPDKTENRILRGVRKSLPELPQDLGLVETFSLLRRAEGAKVVVILDQFEQWLHAHRAVQETELVTALRQCDGGCLQAVVMVRDDFSMAATRFMRELETRILEGHNFATVDLFDVDHAQKVLIKFGQAFGKLPSQSGRLSDDENSFVQSVASGLAQDGKVVSVRLALFAEMVKGKSWIPATLEEVGGTEGIGVNFLEETFSSREANPEHRLHQQAAREVLKALLPEVGSDIKGHMRSHKELLEASGYQNRSGEFNDLLRILDGELRLITPTDPEGFQTESGSNPGSKFYQLTHDYLVPSLRDWLTRKQRENRKGRAELKLAERSALWNAKPENRHLPSLVEWASIRTLTKKRKWTKLQQKMMGKAGKLHGIRSVLSLALLAIVVLGGITIRNLVIEQQRDTEATRLVQGLLKADTSQVETIIKNELPDFRHYAEDDLQQAFDESADDSNAKLHAALAMLPDDKSVLPTLKDRLLTVTPMQFAHVRDLLAEDKNDLITSYWETAKTGETPALRFQAACALATYDPKNDEWQDEEFQKFIAGHLVGVRPSELLPWTNALEPVKEHLTAALSTIYIDPDAGEQVRSFATDTLADYLGEDSDELFDLLADANESQFGVIFEKLSNHHERAIELGNVEVVSTIPEDASEAEKESLAMRQANAAIMLFRMKAADQVWPLLKHSPDPRARSYIIHWLRPRGGTANQIIARYEQETDVTIKRALLLCLGEFELLDTDQQSLIETLLEVYRSDPDAGLHAAAEWLLRQWKQGDKLAAVDKELQQQEEQLVAAKDNKRQWYVNTQGQTFVVLDAGEFQMGSPETEVGPSSNESLHRRKIDRRIAIATKEVTREQWRVFYNATRVWRADQDQLKSYIRSDDSPIIAMTWYEAAHYCNWLSEQEGIPEDQWCYEKNEEQEYGPGMKAKENFLELMGYRLPTEAEWEYACRSGASSSRYYGVSETLLPRYACYLANGESRTLPVASLKPNDFGLFDMLGNAYEWCYGIFKDYPAASDDAVGDAPSVAAIDPTYRRVVRGGSFGDLSSVVRSADRYSDLPDARSLYHGLRPARTYHLFP